MKTECIIFFDLCSIDLDCIYTKQVKTLDSPYELNGFSLIGMTLSIKVFHEMLHNYL